MKHRSASTLQPEARKKPSTIAYERWLWGKHVAPRLGKARIIELRRPDILAFVRKVGQDAGPRTANYAHALVRQLLNFAIQEERLEFNPASVPRVFEYKTRERVLSETEVRRFWVTIEAAMTDRDVPVSPATVLALKLCALTLQRLAVACCSLGQVLDKLGQADLASHYWDAARRSAAAYREVRPGVDADALFDLISSTRQTAGGGS
jgi:integrase